MKSIVLASASPRRHELLKQIGITFKAVPPGIEEDMNMGLGPESLVQELAYSKALDVAGRIGKGYLVIGADTVVVKDRILGKPKSDEEAFHMLKSLQGSWHDVITGISIIDMDTDQSIQDYEKTRVRMRTMSDEMIYSYIDTREPMDKAGAYGIQGFGALLVEKIEGCYFNVVGLPLMKLGKMLEVFKISVL